jgi:hypothetical protein
MAGKVACIKVAQSMIPKECVEELDKGGENKVV